GNMLVLLVLGWMVLKCLLEGLATHFVSSERLPLLEQALVKVSMSDPDAISAIISRFSHVPKLKKESTYHKVKIINRCFSRRTIEEIISTLENEALDKKDDWISSTIQLLKKASPISLKISLRSVSHSLLCDTITLLPELLYPYFRLIRNWSCRKNVNLISLLIVREGYLAW
ncbi:3-hydroxyisobutyryl-coa hydrolase 1, partial [Nicotiana attenuata]